MTSLIPSVVVINMQEHSATCCTPYELVFGQKFKSTFFPIINGVSSLITNSDNDNDIYYFLGGGGGGGSRFRK